MSQRASVVLPSPRPRTGWLVAGLMLAVALPAAGTDAGADDPAQCESASQCAARGAAAYRAGDYRVAKLLFAQQVAWAEQAHTDCVNEVPPDGGERRADCPPVAAVAYNNVALAALRQGAPGEAAAWLRAAPDADATRFNRALVQQALDRSPLPREPAGEYWKYAGYGGWSTLRVAAEGDAWRVAFEGLRFSGRGMTSGPNMGTFDELAAMDATGAVTLGLGGEEGRCEVTARFAADAVELETRADHWDSDCGFGFGVVAAGSFQRVR